MSSILVINAAGRETRVALVENGHIAEFYLERKKDKGVVGNIYKGRVVRVLPGMQAAFVDIGLDKAAFLYVGDVLYDPEIASAQFELTEGEHDEAPEIPDFEGEESTGGREGSALTPAGGRTDSQEPSLEAGAAPHGASEALAVLPGGAPEVPEPSDAGQPEAIGGSAGEEGGSEAAPTSRHEEERSAEPAVVAREDVGTAEDSRSEPVGTPYEDGSSLEGHFNEAAAESKEETTEPGAGPAPALAGEEAVASEAVASAPVIQGHRRAPRDRPRERRRQREEQDRRDEERVKTRKQAKIEDLLKVGQEVLVQISKDPIGSKGARLTSHISIPGRHLVFMPTVDHVGISRRISNEKERRRLRDIVERHRPAGTGFIVRTVAENVPEVKLESDIRFLIEVWNETVRRKERRGGPGLLHPDLDLILRATRDLFAHDVEKLVIDDREEYERVQGFVSAQDAALKERVVLHDSDEPIFDAYGIEQEITRAAQRKVWLKSGGYLIIDQAEALTAIDVNSGRYVGKKSLEETITKINVEAAKEIVYQLRLRNIGGIIICDFIDMEKSQNRERVFKTLQEALGRDKAKTNVLRISELGLVEMTRKRVRESLGRVLHEDCQYCGGQGYVKTATTVCYEIFRELRREAASYRDPTLVINCHSEVSRLLQSEERQELRHLMDRFNKSIQVRPQASYHREQYDIYGRSAQGQEHKVASSGEQHEAQEYGGPRRPSNAPVRGEGRDRGRREKQRGGGRDRRGGGSSGRAQQRQPSPPPGSVSGPVASSASQSPASEREAPATIAPANAEST